MSPSKTVFEKYKPRGLFSEFYGTFGLRFPVGIVKAGCLTRQIKEKNSYVTRSKVSEGKFQICFEAFNGLIFYMNRISAKFRQISLSRFNDIVIYLRCLRMSTKQALSLCFLSTTHAQHLCAHLDHAHDISKASKTD